MIDVHYHKKILRLPENWNELDRDQLIKLAGLLHSKQRRDVAAIEALRILANKSKLWMYMLPLDVQDKLVTEVQWVFESNTLTENLMPVYDGFYGPASEMSNLTMAEFHFCEVFYQELMIDKSEDALNKLCAVLYRKPKLFYNRDRNSEGDVRRKFNSHELVYWANRISLWPKNVKHAIVLFYDGCRQNWAAMYPDIFSGGSDNSQQNYYDGLFGMMRNLAGPKYGTFDKIETMYVLNALLEAEMAMKEAEELQKQMQR